MDPFQNVYPEDIQFNFYFPDESLESLLWDNTSQSFDGWAKEETWTQFLDINKSEGSVVVEKSQGVHTHSEIPCVSETSDESGNNKLCEGENVVVESKSKKRKRSMERGPMFVFNTRSPTDKLDDGYKWRKYGKKTIKSSPHQRSYYMCSDSNCMVKKRVERDPRDREVVITSYEGKHNHESPCPLPIYCIGKPLIVQQSGSRRSILIVNTGL
ncbi:hypothetical protein SUGI_0149560 [Cryptomeria japonica]|uniref:probable WRKY transcription factor 50 n=1 Tax=Cryptomeria japonica TaxID=3369 RepID=UPI002408A5E1|nr:probable WRKY transcription factor 50 [Cryptomeria japonica]GLJ11264.1 hypothetical protein SUGI_0149560 [Cryptomeria japonica]